MSSKKMSNYFNLKINNYHIYERTLDGPCKAFRTFGTYNSARSSMECSVATEHYIHLVEELNDGLQTARLTIIFNMSLFVMFLALV
jgi:hypothetical protein